MKVPHLFSRSPIPSGTRVATMVLVFLSMLLSTSIVMAGQGPTQDDKIPIIGWNDLTKSKKVGQGSFGKVYSGTWNGLEVAIKKLPMQTISMPKIKEDFDRETQLAWRCQFPNIVKLHGICTDSDKPAMVLEFISNGSLHSWVHSKKNISDKQKWHIAMDIAKGLVYLHGNDVLHRDLKSQNILLTKHSRAKICDFGLAKSREGTTRNTGVKWTVHWCAPELFSPDSPPPTPAMDMYSYGLILWELGRAIK